MRNPQGTPGNGPGPLTAVPARIVGLPAALLLAALLLAALLLTAVVASGAGVAGAAPSPSLRAKPHDVMITTTTAVKGKHFSPGSSVQLVECSATSWIAPDDPCTTGNAVEVTVDRKGSFSTGFRVELCPNGVRGRKPTSVTCYIGVAAPSGIDTVALSPYARITVTYP